MRRSIALVAVWVVLSLARAAGADATVPSPAVSDPLARCSMNDGPLRRAWTSGLDAKARAAAGGKLPLSSVGRSHLLLSTWWNDKPARTVVLDKQTLARVVTVEGTQSAGLVESEAGALVGTLALDRLEPPPKSGDSQLRLLGPDGKTRWTSDPQFFRSADSVTTLAAGGLIVVASFHRIATGAQLMAFDAATGARRWVADVVQLNVPHSKYWNDVDLSLDKNRVVMRGYEAGGCYEQTFELATGRRLSSRIQGR